jgi:exosortase
VPFLCAYLLWQRLQKPAIRRQPAGDRHPPSPSHGSAAEQFNDSKPCIPDFNFQLSTFNFCLSAVGFALLWFVARWLHEANPIWRLTSWVLALEVVGLTLFVLRLLPGTGIQNSASGFQLSAFSFSGFVFPISFFLVAVPWPSGLENLLTQSLMQANVNVTTELLTFLGIPALQKGNVIEIATGLVGVDEACSGIRSFQATFMISLFLGELYRLAVLRRSVLCLSGFALAFLFNIGRTLLLVYVASREGIGAIAKWHDPAGVLILLGCFCGLWLIAVILRRADGQRRKTEDRQQKATIPELKIEGGNQEPEARARKSEISPPASVLRPPSSAFRFLISNVEFSKLVFPISLFLAIWFLITEAAVQWWYRSHEQSAGAQPNWSLNLGDANSGYTRINIPLNILGQFNADESMQARWREPNGPAWQLFYFRWLPVPSLKRRVAVQLAKTHGPETCLPAAGMKLKADLGVVRLRVGELDLALQEFEFTAEGGRPLHVFYAIYEDATGGTVLANRRQDSAARLAAAVAGSRNCGQRFLEIAVSGYDDPAGARAGVAEQLARIIFPVK